MDKKIDERLEAAFEETPEDQDDDFLDCDEFEKKLLMKFSELRSLDVPDQQIYLHPLVRSDSIGFITARAGIGKTWFAMSLLNSIATGKSLFPGWSVEKSVRVALLDGELPITTLKKRMSYFDSNDDFYFYSNCYHGKEYSLFDPCFLKQLKKEFLEEGIKVVVIDNLVSFSGGMMDENTVIGYGPINQALLDFRNNGISVIVVHHHGKNGHYRGTSHLIDNIDWHVEINRKGEWLHVNMKKWRYKMVDELKGCKFKMEFDDDGKIRWIGGDKGKLLANSEINVLNLLCKEGMKQVEIAKKLGMSKSRVSKIKAKLVSKGYLTKDNQITEFGKNVLGGEIG